MDKFFHVPFATTGDKVVVPDAAAPSGDVSYSQGYGFDYQRPKTDPAAKNIERDKMNGLFFDITTAIKELQAQGIPDFITSALNGGTAFEYAKNAVVRYSDGELYVSLKNTNTDLPTVAASWGPLSSGGRVVNSIAALRALPKLGTPRAFVTGYYAAGDGGGGGYWYDSTDTTSADNGGTIIVATDGGRWKLQQTGPVSICQFGAKKDGSADATTAANTCLSTVPVSYVPPGTFRCDGCVLVGTDASTLIIDGTLVRLNAYSASTRPVLKVKANYASVKGNGLTSKVVSENQSPTGVLLWGSEAAGSEAVNNRNVQVSGLLIQARDVDVANPNTTPSIGLALISSQAYIGGALYDGIFTNLHIRGATHCVYLNPQCNGNMFSNVNCYEPRGYCVYADGTGSSITDNNFVNFFADAARASHITSYYGRSLSYCCFSGMNGEPGVGSWCNFDSSCTKLVFSGVDNHPVGPSFLATASTFTNGGAEKVADLTASKLTVPSLGSTDANNTTTNSQALFGTLYARTRGNSNGIGSNPYSNQLISSNGNFVDLELYTIGTNSRVILGSNAVARFAVDDTSARPFTDNTYTCGAASYRWSVVYAATGTINTSDERQKAQIQDIEAAILRAWAKVKYCQFKFRDAVLQKGDGARRHFGLIAQRVKEAFESEGLDPFAYGVLCYDEWQDEYVDVFEEVEQENEVGELVKVRVPTGEKRLVREAGNQYGIRYEEALALECAYLRSLIA